MTRHNAFDLRPLTACALLVLQGCETLSPDPPLATAYPRTVAQGARPDAIEASLAAGRSPLVAAYGEQARPTSLRVSESARPSCRAASPIMPRRAFWSRNRPSSMPS